MTNVTLTLEILELLGRILPIILGIIGALVLSSPEKLPEPIRKRRYLYWPIAAVIFIVAGISLYSISAEVGDYFSEKNNGEVASVKTQADSVSTLPEVKLPKVEPFNDSKSGKTSSLSIADIKLGTPINDAIQHLVSRDETCSEVKVVDPALSSKKGPYLYKLDTVFQQPRVIECYRSKKDFEHFYIYPDIYESAQNVFAIARFTSFDGLRVEDVRELLESRYGPSGNPSYQPNYGKGFYWKENTRNLTAAFIKSNKDCFLYLPRAMKSALEYRPVLGGNYRNSPSVHLNSHELKGDCGVVLNGFTLNRGPSLWLFLVNSSSVQTYKKHGNSLVEREKLEQLNEARKKVKF